MNVTFNFDGTRLRLRLSVEGSQEQVMADLMDKFCIASVRVDYGQWSNGKPQGVDIVLREPEPTPQESAGGMVHETCIRPSTRRIKPELIAVAANAIGLHCFSSLPPVPFSTWRISLDQRCAFGAEYVLGERGS